MTGPRLPLAGAKFLVPVLVLAWAGSASGADLYRVEALVFRHVASEAQPHTVESLRGFHDVLDLRQDVQPEAPYATASISASFQDLWRRLQRLDAYQPLAMIGFEQTQVDYHPPVRLHDGEVIAEELHFPGDVVYVDLDREDLFRDYVLPLYRLDGTVQLRRSRFLHLYFDLEYRVEDPSWVEPPATIEAHAGTQEAGAPEPAAPGAALYEVPVDPGAGPPEPFRVHALVQNRQVRTDALDYFDTEFLGVIARVTAIEEEETP